jgi:hypothetical protein
MDNLVTTVTQAEVLVSLRGAVADAVVRAYGAEREYSHALCGILPNEWYLVEHTDTGEDAKKVHAEKKELFKVLKAADHTNPSTVWARVRKYAQAYIEGEPVEGETDSDAEADNGKVVRSLKLRMIEENILLYKALKRETSLDAEMTQALANTSKTLMDLGVDLATIK